MRIANEKAIYSINEGNTTKWDERINEFLNLKKSKNYSARYVGSMVADVHRTLKYGGLFMYPSMKTAPKGKLRLLYECNPMGFIVEQAGGVCSNGFLSILDVEPTYIHERSPTFLGSRLEMVSLLSFLQKV